MAKNSSSINTDFIISFFLPDGMIDWFEVVNIKEEPNRGTAQADVLYNSVLHIYLDERDTRSGEEMSSDITSIISATLKPGRRRSMQQIGFCCQRIWVLAAA